MEVKAALARAGAKAAVAREAPRVAVAVVVRDGGGGGEGGRRWWRRRWRQRWWRRRGGRRRRCGWQRLAGWQLSPRPVLQLIFRRRAWLGLGLGRVEVRDRVGRMCGKERCAAARGVVEACASMRVHSACGCGRVGITRVWGGPADSKLSAAFCLVEGRRGRSRRKGAGKGPRPRPRPVKAHAQLRCDSQRAHLVMTRGRVRDVIVKDRANSACIGA